MHSAINKRVHARKRRVIAHGFSDNAIKQLEAHIQDCTDTFNQHMYTLPTKGQVDKEPLPWSEPYDMGIWCNNLTFDVIAKLIFSKSYGMMENPAIRWIQGAIHDGSKHRYTVGFLPALFYAGIDKYIFAHLSTQRERMRAFSFAQMEERVKDPKAGERNDFMSILTRATDPETGEGFSKMELGAEANLLVTAGEISFYYICWLKIFPYKSQQ